MSDVRVLGYQNTYEVLNLTLKKYSEKTYDGLILRICAEELLKGFKVKKINKATKKGTSIKFTAIEDEKSVSEYVKQLHEKLEELKAKYGED